MEKKIYQAPLTEQIYVDMSDNLLDFLSIEKGEADDFIAGAKRKEFDDFDEYEEEEIEEQSMDFLPKKFKDVWNDL